MSDESRREREPNQRGARAETAETHVGATAQDRSRGATPARDHTAAPLSARDFGRVLWNQLTSMRTALVLLFALALAAIPGSVIPQRPTNPYKVKDFVAANPRLGKVYDALGLFDVYASPWFAAVYLLLFLSLIGCIIPRSVDLLRTLRKPPPRTPTNLARLPEYATAPLPAGVDAEAALERARAHLAGRRFRVERRDADGPRPASVSAERGYLREAGNLVFHIALVFLLLGLALNSLFGYKGDAVVVEGGGFSNSLTQYDDFTSGGRFRESQLAPFTVNLDRFDVSFETGAVQRGAARSFDAHVRVSADGRSEERDLRVNEPITIDGTKVHLIQHGYAVNVTVKDANGDVAFSGPVVCLPQDGNFTSACAIKAPDARPNRLAFEGMFLPTATVDQRGPHSLFPDTYYPQLFLNAWSGPPKTETGAPESVYSVDKQGLTQLTKDGAPVRILLAPGSSYELPGGGSLTFNGYQRWIKLQISQTPGVGLALGSLAVALAGLCCSLYVRPRRLWVRVVERDGSPVVEVAGLDKVEGRLGLDESVRDLLAAIVGAGSAHPADSLNVQGTTADPRNEHPATRRVETPATTHPVHSPSPSEETE